MVILGFGFGVEWLLLLLLCVGDLVNFNSWNCGWPFVVIAPNSCCIQEMKILFLFATCKKKLGVKKLF